MKVVGINGSPRSDGNTYTMIKTVFEVLEAEGIDCEMIQLSEKAVRGCIACYRCVQKKDGKCAVVNDDLNSILDKMKSADGIILGSPVYFADITSEMKAVIDRTGMVARFNGNLFKHKVGAAVVAMRRAGGIHAFDTMNHLFQISQMFVVGSTYWNIGTGRNKGDIENDTEGLETMKELGQSISFILKKIGG